MAGKEIYITDGTFILYLFHFFSIFHSISGNLDNWWEKDTFFKFLNKTSCIIEQYGGYKVKQLGINLNGITTQGENIADNGGIKEAYRAYGNWTVQKTIIDFSF